MGKLLTIVTNAKHLTLIDGEEYPSGYWAEEFAVPYEMFKDAGYTIDVATLGGVAPTADQSSLEPEFMKWVRRPFTQIDDHEASTRYKRRIEGAEGLRSPKDIGTLTRDDISSYDGIYIVGGHGCMEDMRASPPMTRFLLAVLSLDKPLASVCHGPSAFLSPRDITGESPFAGYRMTCFSQEFATKIKRPFADRARDRIETARYSLLERTLSLVLARGRRPQCDHRTEPFLV